MRHGTILAVLGLAAILATGTVATAQPVDGATARKLLFGLRGQQASLPPGSQLTAQERTILGRMTKERNIRYYGAIAYSPADGFLSNSLQGGFNYHDVSSAAAAAMAACNAKKSKGTCVIAGYILPRNWEPRALQLSFNATAAFQEYRRGSGPKALAISPATGMYEIAKGDDAQNRALTACNALAKTKGASDCVIVVAD